MNTSIIIGLLIALVIICATTVVNNIISKNYTQLNSKWSSRTKYLSNIVFEIGRMEQYLNILDEQEKIDDASKDWLMKLYNSMNSIKRDMHSYEYENF